MRIKRLRLQNFKSFNETEVLFEQFNVLVGANASGKSNLIQILRFIRDIATNDLDNAISMQGGAKYIRNIKVGASKDFRVELVTDEEIAFRLRRPAQRSLLTDGTSPLAVAKSTEITRTLGLHFSKRGLNCEIAEDSVVAKVDFFSRAVGHSRHLEGSKLGSGTIRLRNVGDRVKFEGENSEDSQIKHEDIVNGFSFPELKLPKRRVLAFQPFFYFFFNADPTDDILRSIGVYDFDPKLPKRAASITGKAELEDDGSNLASVLKSLLQSPDRRRIFYNVVHDLLPFVETVGIDSTADRSLLFKLREIYHRKEYLPAPFLSDGTVGIAALIVALYFEHKSVVAIEEPERNIHPSLIAKTVERIKDVSDGRQIIVTTHNPGIVRNAGLENLLLVSRDSNGFSRIERPADSSLVRTFLHNEVGLDELYANNLLDGQH